MAHISSYLQIKEGLSPVNQLLEKHSSGIIQKIYSTRKVLCLSIRFPGETVHLNLGRGQVAIGAWTTNELPPSEIRVRDALLEYFRKWVRGGILLGLSIDNQDKIVCITYQKNKEKNFIGLFYKGSDVFLKHYYRNEEKNYLFTPEEGVRESIEIENEEGFFKLYDEDGRFSKKKDFTKKTNIQLIDLFESEKNELSKSNTKSKKDKTIKKIINEMNRYDILNAKLPDLLSSDLAKKGNLKIDGIKIKLDFQNNHYKNLDLIYKKLKALKKGKELGEKRISLLKSKKQEPKFIVKGKVYGPKWQIKKKIGQKDESSSFDVFTYENHSFAIGKSALDNDSIRIKWASKDDTWFHLRDEKSSHVILKGEFDLNSQIVTLVVSALAEYSKIDGDMAEVIYTKVKHLKGLKGVKGTVRYKNEKSLLVNLDKKWRTKVEN